VNISELDVESTHQVSWDLEKFGVIIHGVAKNGIDCTHELTDGQIDSLRWQIEKELKRDAEDSKASDSYYNSLDRAEFDYQTANRRL